MMPTQTFNAARLAYNNENGCNKSIVFVGLGLANYPAQIKLGAPLIAYIFIVIVHLMTSFEDLHNFSCVILEAFPA